MHYLDNASTTPVLPQVAEKINTTLLNNFANPSSLYALGQASADIIESAREVLARALCGKADSIFFTASGTEGSNIAIIGAALARKGWGNHIVLTGYEHPAVSAPIEYLCKNHGFEATVIAPDENGAVDISKVAGAVGTKTVLVAAMHVNNETGSIIDVQKLADLIKDKNKRTFFHSDGVQAFLKTQLLLSSTQIDSYAVSAHKVYAPKGIGALYLKQGKSAHVIPPFSGGGQEHGIRPGTENIAYIAGFAKAVEILYAGFEKNNAHTAKLKNQLLAGLEKMQGIQINSPANAQDNIVNISVLGTKGETMLHFMESLGVYVSSGSACAKGKPSHTLTAMGLPKAKAEGAMRISFGAYNTADDISAFLAALQKGVDSKLRGIR